MGERERREKGREVFFFFPEPIDGVPGVNLSADPGAGRAPPPNAGQTYPDPGITSPCGLLQSGPRRGGAGGAHVRHPIRFPAPPPSSPLSLALPPSLPPCSFAHLQLRDPGLDRVGGRHLQAGLHVPGLRPQGLPGLGGGFQLVTQGLLGGLFLVEKKKGLQGRDWRMSACVWGGGRPRARPAPLPGRVGGGRARRGKSGGFGAGAAGRGCPHPGQRGGGLHGARS